MLENAPGKQKELRYLMHPILFKLGPISIHSYGVMLALAFFSGVLLVRRQARREGIDVENILDLSFVILISAIVGSRALFVLLNIKDYLAHPGQIFMLQQGGLAFHGGLFLALASGIWFLRRKRMKVGTTADLVIPYVALGQAVGRIGCFLNGCCYGLPTNLPWAITFPPKSPAHSHFLDASLHPTQVYQLLANLFIFVVLIKLRRRSRYQGQVFLRYLLLYGVFRFLIEFLRGDNPPILFQLTISQVISLAIFLLATASMVILHTRKV
ncbi:prolipoprotein diacylglyceryl transferase [candidate division NPL-UPA2 bacterium]|nr:prolipoprotein diacylglyceryl transferase [candidate division NPL-UPA2 bacterium]